MPFDVISKLKKRTLLNMKRLVFLTSTRADFGKLKSLIEITSSSGKFDVHIFATGMHLNSRYGRTVEEITKCGYKNIYMFISCNNSDSMDNILAKTIKGFSDYVKEIKPDLIIIHGDRAEALAGAIVGALNNILVAHIEGGEVSGTIDELIRHSVSKMSHTHFVANSAAKNRLIQMGEYSKSIFVIGSPDIDTMLSKKLPKLKFVKKYYGVKFDNYSIALFHPVTTEIANFHKYSRDFVDALIESNEKYILIYPNNDPGSEIIIKEYERLKDNSNLRIYSSLRFEYFLVLLKNAKFIIGNSSAGIREAPYYAIPTVNIGMRQHRRARNNKIINSSYRKEDILSAIKKTQNLRLKKKQYFGSGNSDRKFYSTLLKKSFWNIDKQKYFKDL